MPFCYSSWAETIPDFKHHLLVDLRVPQNTLSSVSYGTLFSFDSSSMWLAILCQFHLLICLSFFSLNLETPWVSVLRLLFNICTYVWRGLALNHHLTLMILKCPFPAFSCLYIQQAPRHAGHFQLDYSCYLNMPEIKLIHHLMPKTNNKNKFFLKKTCSWNVPLSINGIFAG